MAAHMTELLRLYPWYASTGTDSVPPSAISLPTVLGARGSIIMGDI
jgi:hypothetical protein